MSAALTKADTVTRTIAPAPVTILICALGGEGGGVLSEWLVETARHAGYAAQSTSIPGVAQRTGATTYYVEVFPVPIAQLGARRPVFSLYPVPGALDLLVSSELLETVRQIGNGLASSERTQIITSSSRSLTTHERMQMADGRVSSAALLDVVRRHSRRHHVSDMTTMTREAGTVVSAVMFGAIAASGGLPFTRAQCEQTIREGGHGVDASIRGFALAYEHFAESHQRAAFVEHVIGAAANESSAAASIDAPVALASVQQPSLPTPHHAAPSTLPPAIAQRFAPITHPMLALGHARLVEYQDEEYGALYIERMARIADAEARSDPSNERGFAITIEMARYVALWMAFDDIVRVAELKSRASRESRVRREVNVGARDLLRVYDHFKPGVPEIAALLPSGLGSRVLRWDRARQQQGKAAAAWPIKLGTHSVGGMVALRILGGLKGMRRRGSRFAAEQALVERWLAAVERGIVADWTLGHEIALCGRLIKGYGSTNERGKENLLQIIDHLATGAEPPDARATAIRNARAAALADENGIALDRTLAAHGAPARPVKAVPIRFVRKPTPAR